MLMNEMLALMDEHKPYFLFEQIFLELMADDIRVILADDNLTDPRQQAARADVSWQAKQYNETVISNVSLVC